MSDEAVFLGQQTADSDAKFWMIPAANEDGAAMLHGQSAAPAAILAASHYVEPYDEEIATAPISEAPVHTVPAEGETLGGWVQTQAAAAIESVAVPVILGGDPSVSLEGIRALSEAAEDFTILHVTSRARCKTSGPAAETFMREAVLQCSNLQRVVQVGVRSVSNAESEVIFGDDQKFETFFACDLAKGDAMDEAWHEDVIQALSTPVYVSLDLSALDRGVVPSVGQPEPGGMSWWSILRLLKKVAGRRRIAAFDVTDLVPIEGDLNGDYAAARLVYKTMAYMVAGGKMF